MKLFQVTLAIDTGYEVLNRTCVLYADDKKAAGIVAKAVVNKHLTGESYADVKNIIELPVRDGGIIYQDCYQEVL